MKREVRRHAGWTLAAWISAALAATAGGPIAASGDSAAAPSTIQPPQVERKVAPDKKTRPRKLIQRRHIRGATPHFLSLSDPLPAKPGQKITITVRLFGGPGAPRRAAFHLTTNPALVRYVGSVPTGAGALLVEPSANPGELVVYRSSTPGGFAQTDSLVVLEFEAVAPGTTSILLTGVRLFDGDARELRATYESGTLVIE